MNKKIYCTLDTETIGGIQFPQCAYHVGGIIHDRQGNIIASFNYLIAEFWEQIKNDSYAKKNFYKYKEMVENGVATMCPTIEQAITMVESLLSFYNVSTVMAFNSGFDIGRGACAPLVENRDFVDLWLMALQTLAIRKKYATFCTEHNLKSSTGKSCATNAQTFYAYLTENPEYSEEHTAFEDSKIEMEIFLACVKTHKKFTQNCHVNDYPARFRLYPKIGKKG